MGDSTKWLDAMTVDGGKGWTEDDIVMLRQVRIECIARDAEIVRLKAEVTNQRHEIGMLLSDLAAHKRALAAGPAALRVVASRILTGRAAEVVEAAQEAAMKEKS